MNNMRVILPAAALTALVSCGAPVVSDGHEDVVHVSAAISLSDVLTTIADAYHQATGTRVVLNLAGSDTLAMQLIAGAPVDLFLSADRTQMDRVARLDRIQSETRVDLLANQLTIVVPVNRLGSVAAPEDLRLPVVRWIALGNPDSVPAGVYAKAYLESIGVWQDVRDKVVPTRNVKAALAAVEAGNVDAALVYRTDVALATDIRVAVDVPLQEGPAIRYPAAVVRDAENEASARHLLEFLQSGAARHTFEQAGFIVLGGWSQGE